MAAVITYKPIPVESPDGLAVAAQDWGNPNGPEILFIHGLRQSRLSWEKQFADPTLAGFRTVSFDLRGHGANRVLVPENDVADEIVRRKMWRRQAQELMRGLDPARMTRRFRGDLVRPCQQRDLVRRFKARQIDVPEEHDIGIEDAIAGTG